jgi:hypothetical protein
MTVGDRAGLLKVGPGRLEVSGRYLVNAETCQCDGEPVVVSGCPGQAEGFLVVGEGGAQS